MKSTQITAIISVTLVLLILGVVAMLGIVARSVSRDIRQQLGFVVIMDDTTTPESLQAFEKRLEAMPSVENVTFSSAEEVLNRWREMTTEEDEDDALLGINPFSPEFEVSVKEDYSSAESIERITSPLENVAGVAEIVVHSDIARSVNETIRSMTMLLLFVAGGLLIISFILINNTIRLTVYSKRFLIHTMKLVGATGGFIRRPFVTANLIQGAIAAVIACAILTGSIFYLETVDPEITRSIGWEKAGIVFIGLIIIGTVICMLAGIVSANKYLRADYDDMF